MSDSLSSAPWISRIQDSKTLAELDDVRVKVLGKQGEITLALKELGKLDMEERKARGESLNVIRQELDEAIRTRKAELHELELNKKLESDWVDVALPPLFAPLGRPHILTRMQQTIVGYFGALGFEQIEGPEIDDAYHNFDALNIPPLHPARQSHDTFYLKDGRLLRTHTSTMQIRALKEYAKNPVGGLRRVSTGRVYRADDLDATHTPMFHQIEGLVIEDGVHFGHLKGCIIDFCRWFFGIQEDDVRFRASFFPFTEPSAEVDLKLGEKWIEVLGCGMVHPDILDRAGLDPERYQGFAFGMGLERLTMLKHKIHDIRQLYETDVRWLANAPE